MNSQTSTLAEPANQADHDDDQRRQPDRHELGDVLERRHEEALVIRVREVREAGEGPVERRQREIERISRWPDAHDHEQHRIAPDKQIAGPRPPARALAACRPTHSKPGYCATAQAATTGPYGQSAGRVRCLIASGRTLVAGGWLAGERPPA
jgi:hypothetical protein